jgi:hypothetical protein
MGGILRVASVEDFLMGLEHSRARADAQTLAFRGFVEAWASKYGEREVTAGDLLMCSRSLDLGSGEPRSRAIRLGKLLSLHTDQRFGQSKVERKPTLTCGKQYWRLTRIDGDCGGGSGGSGSADWSEPQN